MKKTLLVLFVAGMAFASAPALRAQDQEPMGPPKVLEIIREYPKPGKGGAPHEKVEAGWPRAFAQAKSPVHYLAMTSLTGKSEAWFLVRHDSFAQWEDSNNAEQKNAVLAAELSRLDEADGELLTGSDRIAAVFRPDLSYQVANLADLPHMRYFDVEIARIKPGHVKEYEELVKSVMAASDKSNTGDHWATFEVVSGAPQGTFIFFSGRKSLAIYDKMDEMYGKNFMEALGDEGQKHMREIESNAVMGDESRLFSFSPKMSYVSDDFIKADPDFWKPKAAGAKSAASATKQTPAKPATTP